MRSLLSPFAVLVAAFYLSPLAQGAHMDTNGVFMRDGTVWPVLSDPLVNPGNIPQPVTPDLPNDWVDPHAGALIGVESGAGSGADSGGAGSGADTGGGYTPTPEPGSGAGTPVIDEGPLFPATGAATGAGTGAGTGAATGGTTGADVGGGGSGAGGSGADGGGVGESGAGFIPGGGGSGSGTGSSGAGTTCADFPEVASYLIGIQVGEWTCNPDGGSDIGHGVLNVFSYCHDAAGYRMPRPGKFVQTMAVTWVTEYDFLGYTLMNEHFRDDYYYEVNTAWVPNTQDSTVHDWGNTSNIGVEVGLCSKLAPGNTPCTAQDTTPCIIDYAGDSVW